MDLRASPVGVGTGDVTSRDGSLRHATATLAIYLMPSTQREAPGSKCHVPTTPSMATLAESKDTRLPLWTGSSRAVRLRPGQWDRLSCSVDDQLDASDCANVAAVLNVTP